MDSIRVRSKSDRFEHVAAWHIHRALKSVVSHVYHMQEVKKKKVKMAKKKQHILFSKSVSYADPQTRIDPL